ncbi:hypothetical protein N8I77_000591 [Diaporthe amygdali]|uniref:Uncharacterized protein n=1 Tax=Phomopsis amygdali TaxID=1214568 RepID=A0AAD9W8H3_PHOAM|nr:hypothetical protein N8I77_000591 [Diaporthe amygdali]
MLLKSVLSSVLSRVPVASIASGQDQSPAKTLLNITALSSRDGYSTIECWQLDTEAVYARSALNWIVGGNTTQAELSIIEPRTTVGEAWAPAVQLTAVLNGLIRITAPYIPPGANSTIETHVAYAMPGTMSSSFLIAADLPSISTAAGHYTEFPSNDPTVLVQVPFLDNEFPAYSVLHDGACV